MKNNKIKCTLSLLLVGSLLMSASSLKSVYSTLLDATIPAREIIKSGSKYLEAKSNVTQDFVASIQLDYELFKMEKTTVLYTNYVPVYSLAYKATIHLSDGVDYKGDFLNLGFKHNPAYLDTIRISTDFASTEDITRATSTPSESNSNESLLHLMLDTDPLDGLLKNADNYVEPSLNGGYETSYHLNSTSYCTSLTDVNTTPIDLTDYKLFHFDTIAAALYSDMDYSSNEANTNLKLEYGYCLNRDPIDGVWSATKQDNFSGPMLDDGDYIFCFYGANNYETMGEIESFDLTLSMTGYYGSYKYYNDRFNFELLDKIIII